MSQKWLFLHHLGPILGPDFEVLRPLFRGPLYLWEIGPDLKMDLKNVHFRGSFSSQKGSFSAPSGQLMPDSSSVLTGFAKNVSKKQ